MRFSERTDNDEVPLRVQGVSRPSPDLSLSPQLPNYCASHGPMVARWGGPFRVGQTTFVRLRTATTHNIAQQLHGMVGASEGGVALTWVGGGRDRESVRPLGGGFRSGVCCRQDVPSFAFRVTQSGQGTQWERMKGLGGVASSWPSSLTR